ncbi:MAG: hypothetical protein DI596_01800 [Azospira oryzae]|uniref:Lipoprotein n=1 Tax=Pelomicrobium methylotrophicum TaxID=2602750 RepID=A0A5C7EEL1_9PROT|nr:hypothetical protein [Pelomicrobium methylotrophicum]PZP64503.1 MAG: hypothetical protein DI596_01800 [Azospira oryzae]PZP82466.1 MAG: hypothetical protein DI593_01800 [Azospira oryzae]TXF10008.1 hypothetical protein FR698_16040 [Pelomicrobium methylotrophicum]
MNRFHLYVLMSMATAAAGCATTQPSAPNVNLSGYPPAFKEGYADGCHSARALFGTRKNEARFKNDSLYAQGWRDGYDICRQR